VSKRTQVLNIGDSGCEAGIDSVACSASEKRSDFKSLRSKCNFQYMIFSLRLSDLTRLRIFSGLASAALLLLFCVNCSTGFMKDPAEIQSVISPYSPLELRGYISYGYEDIPVLKWPRVVAAGESVSWGAWISDSLIEANMCPALWRADLGAIDSNGNYTAPATPGMETIRAHLIVNGQDVEDTFEIIGLPVIISFSASATTVPALATVRLFWEAHTGQADGSPIRRPKITIKAPRSTYDVPIYSFNIIDDNRVSGWTDVVIYETGKVSLNVTNDRDQTVTSEIYIECI
jgi:hypothetical protein